MPTLIVTPLQKEHDHLLDGLIDLGARPRHSSLGRLSVVELPEQNAVLAVGGLGKVQYAVQMQYLLTLHPIWELAICVGAAGALDDRLSVGDIVVATSTLEHDFCNGFGPRRLPEFPGAPERLDALKKIAFHERTFQVHFGPIASGDEDIVDADRRDELRDRTQALAVAWEGAGGARSCLFTRVPYLEIRAITDVADQHAPSSFKENLRLAMGTAAQLLMDWFAEDATRIRVP